LKTAHLNLRIIQITKLSKRVLFTAFPRIILFEPLSRDSVLGFVHELFLRLPHEPAAFFRASYRNKATGFLSGGLTTH